MKTAIYPGSFDPITLGHLNIIRRASGIFDRVVVCIMPNAGKLHPMFTREERVALARRVVSRFPNVEVDTFDGLLAEYAKTFPEGAVIVKGLRANTDFENEFQMALINKKINPELDTMFLTASQKYTFLSSSVVKELAGYGADLTPFVPCEIIDRCARTRDARRINPFQIDFFTGTAGTRFGRKQNGQRSHGTH